MSQCQETLEQTNIRLQKQVIDLQKIHADSHRCISELAQENLKLYKVVEIFTDA